MAYYAWSPIDKGGGDIIQVGKTVSAGDVGGKEALDYLIEAGAVREQKYPDDIGAHESPREANLRKLGDALAEAELNAYSDINFNLSAPEEPVPEATGATS